MSRHWSGIAEVKAANAALGHGWFEPSSMGWFETKIETNVQRGRYFVTSEQPPSGPRTFSVREIDDEGRVTTVGEFGGHATRRDAFRALLDAADAAEGPCGHGEIVADPEIEGWENPTEPAVIILRCTDCQRAARVTVEDVALLPWSDDPFGDPEGVG
jgi:hypothetical protein